MASESQRQANRRNGLKGGPKTETGKQNSRLNSLRHGLTSSTLVVMPDEYRHEYEEVLRGFRESFQPHDAAEDALVLRLAQAHWRSLRARRVETGILSVTAGTERARAKKMVEDCPEDLNPHNAIAVGFMTMPAERWQMFLRYDAIARDFFKTLDSLTRLQRGRQREAAVAKNAAPAPSDAPGPPLVFTAGAGAHLSDSGIRSVSQDGPSNASRREQKEIKETKNESSRRPAAHLNRTKPGAGSRASRIKERWLHCLRRPFKRARLKNGHRVLKNAA